MSLPDPLLLTSLYSLFQVSLKVISNAPDFSQNLLHIRAVGTNSTLHYVWSSLGPPAVLLVATNTPNSTLSVNWSLLLSSDPDGGLMVLPERCTRWQFYLKHLILISRTSWQPLFSAVLETCLTSGLTCVD